MERKIVNEQHQSSKSFLCKCFHFFKVTLVKDDVQCTQVFLKVLQTSGAWNEVPDLHWKVAKIITSFLKLSWGLEFPFVFSGIITTQYFGYSAFFCLGVLGGSKDDKSWGAKVCNGWKLSWQILLFWQQLGDNNQGNKVGQGPPLTTTQKKWTSASQHGEAGSLERAQRHKCEGFDGTPSHLTLESQIFCTRRTKRLKR